MKRQEFWFVYPKNDKTNDGIAAMLAVDLKEDSSKSGVLCLDNGQYYHVWPLTKNEMEVLENSKASKGYNYISFKSSEQGGPMRIAVFPKNRLKRG